MFFINVITRKQIYVAHIIFLLDSNDLDEEKGIFTKNSNTSYKVVSTIREGYIKCNVHTVEGVVGRIRKKAF